MDGKVIQRSIRRGESGDEEWLFQLFKTTMHDYIDAAWGWEELLQKEGFVTSLPARNFQILEVQSQRIGCIHLSHKPDHLLLDMLIIEPAWQRQQHGRNLVDLAKQQAVNQDMPLRLSVLKTNPAVDFHRRCGFEVQAEDEHSYRMQWLPANSI